MKLQDAKNRGVSDVDKTGAVQQARERFDYTLKLAEITRHVFEINSV